MKKALIIGLGNILKGDLGIGCYILEALTQEQLGESVHLAYLGDDPRYAAGLLYKVDFVIVVSAFNLGGPSGSIHYWSYEVLLQNATWIINENVSIRLLIDALARAEMAGGCPEELSFLWVESQVMEGFEISTAVRKAIWKAVRIIKKNLFERGFLHEGAMAISPIYRIELPGTVI